MKDYYMVNFTIEEWNSIKWNSYGDDTMRKLKRSVLISIMAPIVDIYTVSRMFKTF